VRLCFFANWQTFHLLAFFHGSPTRHNVSFRISARLSVRLIATAVAGFGLWRLNLCFFSRWKCVRRPCLQCNISNPLLYRIARCVVMTCRQERSTEMENFVRAIFRLGVSEGFFMFWFSFQR
jgi:hypothetical protein